MKVFQLSLQYDLNQFVVRISIAEIQIVSKYFPVGNLALQKLDDDCYFLTLDFESFGVVWRFSDGLVQS